MTSEEKTQLQRRYWLTLHVGHVAGVISKTLGTAIGQQHSVYEACPACKIARELNGDVGEEPMLVPLSAGLLRRKGLLAQACSLFDLEVVNPEGHPDCDEAGAVVRSQSFWCSSAGPDGVLLWNDNLMLTQEQLALLGLEEGGVLAELFAGPRV